MSNVSLNLYRIFCVVAQSKSYAEASEKLNITISTISTSIMKLENLLETKLFDRSNDGVSLTNSGEELLELIGDEIETIDFAEKIMLDKTEIENGEITIGCQSHITMFYLMDYINKAKNDYPNLNIRLIGNTNSEELFVLLQNHKVDFVITNLIPDEILNNKKFIIKDLKQIENIFISKDPLQIKKLEDFNKYSYVLSCDYTNSNKLLVEYLKKYNIKLKPSLECDITEVRVEAVKRNLGVGYVIREAIKKELENKELYEVKIPIKMPGVNIKLIYNKGKLTRADRIFIKEYLKK